MLRKALATSFTGLESHKPCLSLDRFYQEGCHVPSMYFQSTSQVFNLPKSDGVYLAVIVVQRTNTFKIWSKASPALRICAHAIEAYFIRL